MKLIAKLKSFKQYFGMTAELLNNDGDIIDTITIGEDGKGKKLKFKFDEDDLNGSNNVELVFADNNGNDKNFESGDDTFDMNPDDQDFDVTIKSNKKKTKAKIKLKGDELSDEDTTGPVFTSGATATASETITAGTIVYSASATDDSPPVSFSLSGTDAGSFSISAQGQVSINASPDFATKSSYSFNVVGTDAAGNSTTQTVALTVIPATANGGTITLSAQADVYSETVGGQVIGTDFVENANRFTSASDTVIAAAGTLGAGDELSDSTAGDNDALNLSTNDPNNLQTAVAGVVRAAGIENFNITATNDNSAAVNLAQFSGLEKVTGTGTFDAQVVFSNYIAAGARTLDFSGVSTGGVDLSDNSVVTSDPITMLGSGAADTLTANNGAATISGGNGIDTINGSTITGSSITGGNGRDVITLNAASDVDRVNLATVTTTTNGDDITGFVGANTNANAADLLVFDAATFTTYTAGNDVQQVNATTANASGASNLFIVDTGAAIAGVNTQTGQGTLALRNDAVGTLFYSSNGDFTSNSVDIGTINDFANFVAAQNTQII